MADTVRNLRDRELREVKGRQDIVGRCSQIGLGVNQGAVEVED
jgi:hypothetical protein